VPGRQGVTSAVSLCLLYLIFLRFGYLWGSKSQLALLTWVIGVLEGAPEGGPAVS
jgi:hypothetical protein